MTPAADGLSEAALRYIAGLHDQDSRNEAAGWARMDPMEFQARMGTFGDGIDSKFDRLLEGQSFRGQVKAILGGLSLAGLMLWELVVRRGDDIPR